MLVNTNSFVAMTEANQNFSKVIRMVDENGMAIILKNNKPRYVLVDFNEYDEIQAAKCARLQKISDMAELLIEDNMEAFKELAKWYF